MKTVPLDISNFMFYTSARYVFTKVLRPFTKRWRGRGIKDIIYIDDGIATFRGFEIAKSVCELVRNNLLSAGFVINNEKNDFNPKTKGKWLGTIIDTRELTFTVPKEKITKLLEDITMYLNREFVTPKTTFFHAFGDRPISSTFYEEHISFHRKTNFLVRTKNSKQKG